MSQTQTAATTAPQDLALLLARLLCSGVFLVGAYWKLTGTAGFVNYFAGLGLPAPGLAVYGVMALEFVLPLLLILGLQARSAALALAAFTLVATALSHRYWEFPAAQQFGQAMNFWRNLALVSGLGLIAAFGPGRFALRR